ncbi:MAG TPA: aminotransferase class V-fold PLP-dependent enzyme [Chloroflexaceae bacterium]|nr:aminotransferase class V-fold PLP-dependent enzyme [Chloroflexaceae bacterium]
MNSSAAPRGPLALPLPELAGQFLLRPGMAFLNHGSFGACPRPVFKTYRAWQRELEAQPVEFLGRRVGGLLAEARVALGAYLGAPADDLAFVPNATHAVNIVARSLALAPGDEVLATDHEYGAVDRTWRFVCGQRGARYVRAPVPLPLEGPAQVVEALWARVTPRTRAIVVSHITSPTALTFPVAAICRRAREAGILTVVDGAHAPGQIALDLPALGADFYAGNCHKWLCAPKGAGFLYARPEAQALLSPLVVSWGWEAEAPGPSPFVDHFGWTGTADPAAYLSVPAAIAFQREHDWPAVRAACHALLLDASRRLAELTGLPPLSPDGGGWWAQMRALPLPPCDSATLKRRLWDEHAVEVPIVVWQGRPLVRVSVQAYNSPGDIERLVAGLVALL